MIWRADGEAGGLQALGDGRRVQRAVPDVGDVAGEERPGLAPVGAVVVQHLAGAPGRGRAGLVPPGRVVLHAVGRIGDHQQRGHAAEHPLDVGRHGGVAAEQPVRPEQPEVARPADRVRRASPEPRPRPRGRRPRRRAPASSWSSSASEKPTTDRSKSSASQLLQLAGEQRLVPGAELGQLVVGDPVGPPLLLGQVVEHDHRRLGQPELRGRQDAAVPGDHLAVARHQHRHRPAELRHRARDLRDLVRPVRLGVPRIGLQALERPSLDALRSEAQGHVGSSCRRRRGGFRGVDSALDSTGPRWTPSGSRRKPPPEGSKALFYWQISGEPLDSGGRVASQKFAAVASELPR